jgi:DNA repair exonuclease SbcCD ATPase subunit
MASLADLNVRLGADVSPLARGLNQAKGSISSFTGSIQTANTVLKRTNNTILEVDSAIEGLEQAYINARTAQARFAIGAKIKELRTLKGDMIGAEDAVNAMGGGFSSTSMAVVNFNRVVQDAPFGILGVANNIEPLLLSFQSLKKEAGSTGMALKQLIKGAFTGPGALITVFSVVSSLAIVFSRRSRDTGKAGEEASEGISKQAEALREVAQAYESLNQQTTEQAIDNEIAFTREVLDNTKALQRAKDTIEAFRMASSGAQGTSVALTDAQKEQKAEAIKNRDALQSLIDLYGEDALTVEELEKKITDLTNAKNGLNNSTRTEVQLGRVIQDQQVKTAQATDKLTAGIKGAEDEAKNQALTLSNLINQYRTLANDNEAYIPVVNALQKQLDGLSKSFEDVTGEVLDYTRAFAPGIPITIGGDVVLDLDLDALGEELNKTVEGFNLDPGGDLFISQIGSINDLTRKMRELQMIQAMVNDPEQYQLLQVAINAIGGEIDLLKGSTDNLNSGFDILDSLATRFTDSFGQGMANVVVQGEKLEDILDNIGRLLLSSAIQTGIKILLTGGMKGGGFFGKDGGLLGNLFKELGFSGSVASAVPTTSMPSPSIVPVLSTVSNAENTAQSFERALENYTARLGPNEFFALSQKGRLGY